MSHDRNEKTPGILKVDQEIAYKVEIGLLKRQLAEKEKAVKEDSVKQVEGVCDFSLEDHPNGHCLPQRIEEQAKYMGNGYNPGWSKHPNLCWDQTGNQAQAAPQHKKPSPLEELLNKFASISKTKFEKIQTTVANQGATIKSLETQIANNDPWDHLSKFSETCQIHKVPENVTEDQKKMRLFAFSLTGPAKDWLQCLPRGSIATWKELEDKFLERFFTNTLFQKRKYEILSFKQHESETLCEAYERFKLLMRRCPNHSISAMEQMQLFTTGMKMQHHMILDASAGGSIKFKTYAETKDLVEQMCQNEYNMSHDRNEKTPGILKVDQEIAYKVEIGLLKRQLAEKEKAVKEDSVKQVEGVCDFSLEDHPNGHCLPQRIEEQAKYMGNGYNPGWSKHPNLCWDQTGNQAQAAPQHKKPSPLEELLNKFASISKTKFEKIQTTVANQGATIKSLETQIANNDPWDHLSKFSETCQIHKVPENVTEDQKKMRLFAFSLTGPAKDWLQCLPRGSIATWKELEDKFLERFFTNTLFQKRKYEILSFKQHESETLCEAYERFKLLMRRCPNHSISAMEQMQLFTTGMKMQHHMILDASAGGSIKFKTYAETKDLVEQMCQNEYNMSHDRNEKTPGILKVDQEIAYKVEIGLLKRQLAEKEKAVKEDSVKQVEGVCDFSLEDHPNGHCFPQRIEEQAKYMGNGYNPGWSKHPNLCWDQTGNQAQAAPQHKKPSPLEELLNKFASISKTKFEKIQTTVANQGATIKSLETQIANNDPWDHLSKFSETCQIHKVPENVTEDQKKMRLFAFSLTGPAKDWLQCLPRGSIATWKELEDKFLERFFTNTLFKKRKYEILSFKQHESETLCEAYERFKLLMRRCPNHSISAMEQMQLFTTGMKMQHHMILDASAGGSIKFKTYAETKDLVEQMCQNEYNISHDRNEKTHGILKVDPEIAYKVEIELLKRQLAEKEKAAMEDSVK
ncbi:hypothetical protein QL285_093953 [Trifolium repens]|nr:hypothetical protein QL285_093953 [Trifolium repens]